MGVATTLETVMKQITGLLPSPESGDRNFVREAWDKLHALPGGKAVFSKVVGRAAPYTGTVDARVEELRAGYARVTMRDRPAVRNHLRCVHAIALLNLAELTGNAALAYSMPDDARFIVAGMSIDYLKKARGTITGECECPIVTSSERHEYQVPVNLKNAKGEVVATVSLRTLVGPKKA
ncbi:MAG: hotdog fold domain-containing protein [Polyangiales bacterium]